MKFEINKHVVALKDAYSDNGLVKGLTKDKDYLVLGITSSNCKCEHLHLLVILDSPKINSSNCDICKTVAIPKTNSGAVWMGASFFTLPKKKKYSCKVSTSILNVIEVPHETFAEPELEPNY